VTAWEAKVWATIGAYNRGRQDVGQPSKSSTWMFERADPPLFGRGALVTGAGHGIGRAIAQRLAALGATVLGVSRTQSELDETVRSAGSRAFALALDISADGAAREIRHRAFRGPQVTLLTRMMPQ
jgi:phosphoglycerate dehydrogenase-like enzyme